MATTKVDLIRGVATAVSMGQKEVEGVLDAFTNMVIEKARDDGECVVPGLGKLIKAERAARDGRNPQTGEKVKIPAKITATFRVAKAAKDSMSKK
jgi:DNA-binding protein HU-beta